MHTSVFLGCGGEGLSIIGRSLAPDSLVSTALLIIRLSCACSTKLESQDSALSNFIRLSNEP